MPEPTIWPLDEHGRAKHELLRHYLQAWFPILSKANERVVFLDGFAGPGIYDGGEPGSPIVALETLLDQYDKVSHMRNKEFVFVFCEEREDRYLELCRQLDAFERERGGYPPGVRPVPLHTTFRDMATELLDILTRQRAQLAPTFAFLDPFGISGVSLSLIARLLAFRQCELLINFMFRTVQRFGTAGNIDAHLDELFGTGEYRDAREYKGAGRKQFLHDLFRRRLTEVCKFEYVRSFEMLDKRGQTAYFLFHGTRHIKGVEVMKDAMWKVDPSGGARFADRFAGQQVLFQNEHVDVGPLKTGLLQTFGGREVSIQALERYTILETPYRKAHLRRLTLKPLEDAGKLTVVYQGKRSKGTFPDGSRIRFAAPSGRPEDVRDGGRSGLFSGW